MSSSRKTMTPTRRSHGFSGGGPRTTTHQHALRPRSKQQQQLTSHPNYHASIRSVSANALVLTGALLMAVVLVVMGGGAHHSVDPIVTVASMEVASQASAGEALLDDSAPSAHSNGNDRHTTQRILLAHTDDTDVCAFPDVSIALTCLHKTTPSLNLTYPSDALEHFRAIDATIAKWMPPGPHCHQKYCGPWIETYWTDEFRPYAYPINNTTTTQRQQPCLSKVFGPFIPIFFPWTDMFVSNRSEFPLMAQDLMRMLRPDVAYLTVAHNDQGISKDGVSLVKFPNVLVMSSGGYGHVPVPMFLRDEDFHPELQRHLDLQEEKRARAQGGEESSMVSIPRQLQTEDHTGANNRTWLISYAGKLKNAPRDMRMKMHNSLKELLGSSYQYYYGPEWRELAHQSWTSLAPRGFGRTSFHLMEIMQQGHIPIHVYVDIPWIPFASIYDLVAFKTTVEELPALMEKLSRMTPDEFRQREQRIAKFRQSHFCHAGVMHHIRLFMTAPSGGDLECRPLPQGLRLN